MEKKYRLCPDCYENWDYISDRAEVEVAFQEQFMTAEDRAKAVYACSRFRSPNRHTCDGVVRKLRWVSA
jgi:hypothetical protein